MWMCLRQVSIVALKLSDGYQRSDCAPEYDEANALFSLLAISISTVDIGPAVSIFVQENFMLSIYLTDLCCSRRAAWILYL